MRVILNIGANSSANFLDSNTADGWRFGSCAPSLAAIVGIFKDAPYGVKLACVGLKKQPNENAYVVYVHLVDSQWLAFCDWVALVLAGSLAQDCIAVSGVYLHNADHLLGNKNGLFGQYADDWGVFDPAYFVTVFDQLLYW